MILFRVEGLLSALFFAYVYVRTILDRIKICKNDTKICVGQIFVLTLQHYFGIAGKATEHKLKPFLTMSPYPIHVGSLIRAELNRQDHSVTWLAEQLGIERTNCYRFLRAQSLHIDILARISIAMQHDFFADLSKQISKTFK